MWNSRVQYFQELCRYSLPVVINLRFTDKVCTGYIRVVNDDGVFVTTEMGDGQEPGIEDVIFVFYSAISFVESGL